MENKLFQTSSLNVVAWLLMKEFKIIQKVRIQNQTIFYFERNDRLFEALNEYHNNDFLMKFISFYKEVKMLAKE